MVYQVRHYMSVVNISHAFIACLWGNNENDFVYRSLERDLMEEQDIIEQEGYFWREFVVERKGGKPPACWGKAGSGACQHPPLQRLC